MIHVYGGIEEHVYPLQSVASSIMSAPIAKVLTMSMAPAQRNQK